MIKLIRGYIKTLTGAGKARTGNVTFNIVMSFLLRAVSIVVSFLVISFSLKLLDTSKYGIWLAISSTVGWVSILDIGLANGLRNKIAEYLAVKDYGQAKIAVSSTYAILFMIMIPIILFTCFGIKFINWNSVFNTKLDERELLYTLMTVFIGLSLQFILKPISSILQGDQKIYKSNQIQLVCNFVPLIPIIFFSQYLKGSMVAMALAQTILPVFVLLIYTIILFQKRYCDIKPSVKHINLQKSKSLFGLSFAFFIVQIAGVFLYSTTELIITREFGGSDVTLYNLLFKYLSTAGLVFNIILASYWSAFTNAFALRDFTWIKASIAKLLKISFLLLGVIVLQLLLVKPVFNLWVGKKINVPLTLSLTMAIYFGVTLFTSMYAIVLNGTGKVKMQSIVSIITAILHIPVVLFFIRYLHFGLNSLVYASIIWALVQVVVWRNEIKSVLKLEQKPSEPDVVYNEKIAIINS
ncbi:MAG: MATE family efflux transporter [Bacteroidota bacterium]|nr:MATE family efflux transporter [Bacteroidota bacterium]